MDIGFLTITIWDILDILIVGFLIYQIYRLLRGSVAFNIFIGVVLLYVIWWLVKALNMELLSLILGQFVSVGVIILIIIFQPEVRRFLLYLGDTTLKRRSWFFEKFLVNESRDLEKKEQIVKGIYNAMEKCSKEKVGVLIVLSKEILPETGTQTGVPIDAKVSSGLIQSIFHIKSPLHDGAVVIHEERIALARAILPVSQSEDLPPEVGLRHRAALGITENSNVCSLVVSEETGNFSYAVDGRLYYDVDGDRLFKVIEQNL